MIYHLLVNHPLPHSLYVNVPVGDSKLFKANSRRGLHHYVRPEVLDWLHANVGDGDSWLSIVEHLHLEWCVVLIDSSCSFCFRSRDKAALFKLVWTP